MNRMPEVYEDIETFKAQLTGEDNIIVYCTPEVAAWYVDDEDYLEELRIGEAVKVTKWMDELQIVPVKWEQEEITGQWDWVEIGEPYYYNE